MENGEETPKGYLLADFEDAFARYLPTTAGTKRHNATTPASIEESSLFPTATPAACGDSESTISTNSDAVCGDVADAKGETNTERIYV